MPIEFDQNPMMRGAIYIYDQILEMGRSGIKFLSEFMDEAACSIQSQRCPNLSFLVQESVCEASTDYASSHTRWSLVSSTILLHENFLCIIKG